MLVFDTNILVYAVDEDSPFHAPCRDRLLLARDDPSPSFLTCFHRFPFLSVVDPLRIGIDRP